MLEILSQGHLIMAGHLWSTRGRPGEVVHVTVFSYKGIYDVFNGGLLVSWRQLNNRRSTIKQRIRSRLDECGRHEMELNKACHYHVSFGRFLQISGNKSVKWQAPSHTQAIFQGMAYSQQYDRISSGLYETS